MSTAFIGISLQFATMVDAGMRKVARMPHTELCPYCRGTLHRVCNITIPPQDIFQCTECTRLYWPTVAEDQPRATPFIAECSAPKAGGR